MKLISKTMLRRAASDPVQPQPPKDSSSSSSSSRNTMTVDLADKDTLPALRVLPQTISLCRNVHTAIVNAESCVWYGHIKMDELALVEAFKCLSELPRLHHVTVDLSHLQVPVSALTALLRGATVLRELHLKNTHLVGQVEALEAALRSHTHLTRVRFLRCEGSAIQSFMAHLPCLKKLELRLSSIGVVANNDGKSPWTLLARSSTLQSLTLQEIPDLKTHHVLTFTKALSIQQEEGGCNLQELHISSANGSVDGELCAPAVADFLMLHPNSTIKNLTMKFGSTWKTADTTISNMLRKNLSITSLCVELATKDATAQSLQVLSALQCNKHLKSLKLLLDLDQQLDGPLESCLLEAIEVLLGKQNHVLQSLIVLDENREKYPLTPAIGHQLELNASRLPKLLHSATTTASEYLEAMIESKDNLDAVFYAVFNQPNLVLNLSPSALALFDAADSSRDEEDPTAHWGKASKPGRHSAKKRLLRFFKHTIAPLAA